MADGVLTAGYAGAASSLMGASIANRGSSRQAKLGRAFTREMMRKKYQWQMEDMRNAGLNPILAAGATPGMGSSPTATMQNEASDGVNSALATRMQNAQIRKINAETENIKQQHNIKSPIEDITNLIHAITNPVSTTGVNLIDKLPQIPLPAAGSSTKQVTKKREQWRSKRKQKENEAAKARLREKRLRKSKKKRYIEKQINQTGIFK